MDDRTCRTCNETKSLDACNETKSLDAFEVTVKGVKDADGRVKGECRWFVCKPCYAAAKAAKAKAARPNHDPANTPLPAACATCFRAPGPDVLFKWRGDTKAGGWRNECNACYNAKGYSQKHRAQTDVRFKNLVKYARRKKIDVNADDADALVAKMTMPCHYCGHEPEAGTQLSCLDRVNPDGGYDDSNTVPSCGVCNYMKLTFHVDEFIHGVRDIMAARGDDATRALEAGTPRPVKKPPMKKDKTDELSDEQRVELLVGECYLCDRAPAFGIDRVDSEGHYTPDNCRSCCSTCNFMKRDWTPDVFLAHVARIHAHTATWVLGDARKFLSWLGARGPRQPVAVLNDDGSPLIVFPSAATATKILGTTVKPGKRARDHDWQEAPVAAFKAQRVEPTECKRILTKLRCKHLVK